MLHKLWLTFHDHELEKRFQSEFNRWGAFTDKGVLIFTVFLRIAILAKLWLARVDQRDFFATLVVSIPVAIEFVGRKYMEKHHPHLLKEWRPTLVASSRIYMSMFFGRCIPFWVGYAVRRHDAIATLERYPAWLLQFVSSGIPLRFALTFGMPLRFAEHFPLMITMATVTTVFTRSHYCKFLSSPAMASSSRSIFEMSDYLAEFAWDQEGSDNSSADKDLGSCPCARLLAFTNIYWGVCIASYLWWNVEYRLRISFLRNTIGNTSQVRGVVKMMSLYPWVIATFSIPVFSILWRGSKAVFNILENVGIIKEAPWLV